MVKTYWDLLIYGVILIAFGIFAIIFVCVQFRKGALSKNYVIIGGALMIICMCLTSNTIISCIKDYKYVSNNEYLEADAVVVEFTYAKRDLDGNGQMTYAKPKFYIEETNEYIILHVKDVEVGEKYRIRYLPNTKICEVLYHIE